VEHVFAVMKLKFGFCEAALPRTEEECQPVVCGVRAGEPVSAAEEVAAARTSLAPLRRLLITGQPPKLAATMGKTESERLHWHG
jgi:hypothetical protein